MRIASFAAVATASWLFAASSSAVAAPCADFTDVEDTSPFCPSVTWMKNRGITTGCTATEYCPDQSVSRLAMAAFLFRNAQPLGPAVQTALVGGTGGGAYSLQCPDGAVVVGVDGNFGGFEQPSMGSIRATCRSVSTGALVKSLGAPTQTGLSGGAGGGAWLLFCPANHVLTGVSGSTKPVFGGAGTVVENLSIQCTPIGGAEVATVGPAGAGNTTPFSLPCPDGTVATGIGPANADQLLDAIRLTCR